MPFDWNKVGTRPRDDEVEITVMGPGFGESILVHVGNGRWIIVDSCIDSSDPTEKQPAAARYLRAIGVDLQKQVELVVATHWHDDHIRGLGALFDACKNADFCCANSLLTEEFLTFVEQMGTGTAATDGAKLRDFRQVIRRLVVRGKQPVWALPGRTLRAWRKGELAHEFPCQIRSLSPSDKEFSIFLTELGKTMPNAGRPLRAATARSPNLASTVIHIDFEVTGALLGADMELHNDPQRGWTSVVEQAEVVRASKAKVLKVPHHGSINGHHEEMWTKLLISKPAGVLTPFSRLPANRRLPTKSDAERIVSLTVSFPVKWTLQK
jgi:hypothetical protein